MMAYLLLEWFFFRQLSVVNTFICNNKITYTLIKPLHKFKEQWLFYHGRDSSTQGKDWWL